MAIEILHHPACRCVVCIGRLVEDLADFGIPEHEALEIVLETAPEPERDPPPVYVDGDPRCPKCGRPARISRSLATCKSTRCDWRRESP